jgi:hypothetical protein
VVKFDSNSEKASSSKAAVASASLTSRANLATTARRTRLRIFENPRIYNLDLCDQRKNILD